jgi:hypothetical protein
VWRNFFAGTKLEKMIRGPYNDDMYYNSDEKFKGYPLPRWRELTGSEITSSITAAAIRKKLGDNIIERDRILQRIADDFIIQSHRAAFNDSLSGVLGIPYLATALRGPIHQLLLEQRNKVSDCTTVIERVTEGITPGSFRMLIPLPLTLVLAQIKRSREGGDQTSLDKILWKSLAEIRDQAWPFRQLIWEIEKLQFDEQQAAIDKLSRELREKSGFPDALKSAVGGSVDLALKIYGVTPVANLTISMIKAGRASGYLNKVLEQASRSMFPSVREQARLAKDWVNQRIGRKCYFPLRLQKVAQAFANDGNLTLIREV